MRLADKRFRGPDREPWDPQRALTLGLRCGDVCSHSQDDLRGYPFHLRHRDGQVHVLGARVDVRGDACRPPCASIWLTTRKACSHPFRSAYGPRSMIPTPRMVLHRRQDGGRREQQVASKVSGLTTSPGTPCVRWQARQQFHRVGMGVA
jgi:hypothetical protein